MYLRDVLGHRLGLLDTRMDPPPMGLEIVVVAIDGTTCRKFAGIFAHQSSWADTRLATVNGESLANAKIFVAGLAELSIGVVGVVFVVILVLNWTSQEVGHVLWRRSTTLSTSSRSTC